MEKIKKSRFLVLGILFLIGLNCKKNNSDFFQPLPPQRQNTAPIINKEQDLRIFLPTNYVPFQTSILDSELNIKEILWRKITGPDSFRVEKISETNNQPGRLIITTLFSHLEIGKYDFELTAIDQEGLMDKDTISITVNSTNIINGNELNFRNFSWTLWDWWYYTIMINDINLLIPAGASFKIYIKRDGSEWQEVPLATSGPINDWPYTYFIKDAGRNLYVYYDYWLTNLGMGDSLQDSLDIKIVY